jgi:ribosomal protein RSM22 (predicted rRNA methylase)
MSASGLALRSDKLFAKLEELLRGRPAHFRDEIDRMRRLLTEKRASLPSGYMNQPKLLSAYLSYHFPLHLPEIAWILEQSFHANELVKPEVVIELGSGPGTASLGAALWLEWNHKQAPREFAFFDQSRLVLDMAQDLTRTLYPESQVYKVRGNLFSREDRSKLRSRADWLILSHVLNEIGNGPRYRETKLELLRKVAQDHLNFKQAGATLIVIEPPLREPTLDLMWLRDEMNNEI